MPMGRDLGEIKRDRTEIGGIWKVRGSVGLGLMIVLVFVEVHGKERLLSGDLPDAPVFFIPGIEDAQKGWLNI